MADSVAIHTGTSTAIPLDASVKSIWSTIGLAQKIGESRPMSVKRKIFLIDNNWHHGLRENLRNFFIDFDVIDIDSRSRASLVLLYEFITTKPEQVYTIISLGELAFTFLFDNRIIQEKTDIPIVFLGGGDYSST